MHVARCLLMLSCGTLWLGQSSLAGHGHGAFDVFGRDNLVAWCIVPFDDRDRSPHQRAEMLKRLGISKFAYDYRAQHVPTFDAEMGAIKEHGIELVAWWFPATLNDEARQILDVLKRHGIKTQLWVTGGGEPTNTHAAQQAQVRAEARRIRPIAEAAAQLGCRVGLYNHGGWFGQPANQIAIIKELNLPNVGIVYNLHHGHEHVDQFAQLLAEMKPYLYALNLNGMVRDGERKGLKIVPIGAGELDLELLKIIRHSGYTGPIGILNHTQEDAEARLQDNLDGLHWLLPQLDGKPATPKPRFRTWSLPASRTEDELSMSDADKQSATEESQDIVVDYSPQRVADILAMARQSGDAQRGAAVFTSAKSACLNCHRLGKHGGTIGPELTDLGKKQPPEAIIEAVYWPRRGVKPEFIAHTVATADGGVVRGYKVSQDEQRLVLRDPATGIIHQIDREEIETHQETGTLMPDGLTAGMSPQEQADLVRFLLALGNEVEVSLASLDALLAHAHIHLHAPADFPHDRAPLRPEDWPSWQEPVNRDRVYDYYSKQAEYFRQQPHVPPLLPGYPGLDGGKYGHWGNQDEETWEDGRWNDTDLGLVQGGIFRGAGVTVPRGVCVRLGEDGELSACFNPETLSYEAVWKGGFVKFSSVRGGFLHGLQLDGTPLARPEGERPREPFRYRGYYRHGRRVVFAYRIGDVEYLDAPWAHQGQFQRTVAPAAAHPFRHVTQGGLAQWPQTLCTEIEHGRGSPYAVDTVHLPYDNPWRALLFCGDHAFDANGVAYICTMQGDVWRLSDYAYPSRQAGWKRFAAGLHHALGMVVDEQGIFVLGRDQITRLHDLNGNGEADFYECYSQAYETSAAGHDFIAGLQRGGDGYFYTASGNQGVVRIRPDGQQAGTIANGLRNPDGICLTADDLLTVPCSEGEWTPASMICAFRVGDTSREPADVPFFGYGGPRGDRPPNLPLVYLPRGLDNSSGGQAYVDSDRWGPLGGQLLHFSYGTGTHFLVLRDEVAGQLQGAVVPLQGEFRSGVHRGRFSPHDGQLYVAGMGGWGTYTTDDGCFQRVRYTGDAVQLPIGFHVHENGVLLRFSAPLDETIAANPKSHFAQCWNYRYGPGYGSPELSARHPHAKGHDPLAISAAHVLLDKKSLFLELPELQPVNQLHLRVHTAEDHALDLFATVHALDAPYEALPGYRSVVKTIAPHPIHADMILATQSLPNPWRGRIAGAREVRIECGTNLTFATQSLKARAGEPLQLTLINPDVVPHNWVLVKPGALRRVGELSNRLIADPQSVARHYIPETADVLAYTDVVLARDTFTIYFRAPDAPGRYPYLCTFPGHWLVMNGELLVEAEEPTSQ